MGKLPDRETKGIDVIHKLKNYVQDIPVLTFTGYVQYTNVYWLVFSERGIQPADGQSG